MPCSWGGMAGWGSIAAGEHSTRLLNDQRRGASISLLHAAKGRRGGFLRDNSGSPTISTLTVRWSSSNPWSPKRSPPQACRAGRRIAGKFPYRHTQKRHGAPPLA